MASSTRGSGLSSLSRLVYSTEGGRTCPDCKQALADCRCAALKAAAVPAGDGVVRISRETKGRGGKAVSLVRGVPLNAEDLAKLAKELKAACGSGGTVKDGVIEIQGDHVALLMQKLEGRGWKVKRAGG
ncbi:translation initiation factor Sui1 [Ideonella azotifigens]|uniref:Translation initiation factor Sui1 n=1 Tax=Ideonella azotifigens TaxID=513160 RepID=A0ABN2Y7P4_9BURK|nr:translation initiation factor Sui1 [Ideonella azotifigens]MCD2342327.1 translation initiation factor Sui1 [Ideonella azotifigens]